MIKATQDRARRVVRQYGYLALALGLLPGWQGAVAAEAIPQAETSGTAAPTVAAPRMDIWEYRVEGNTLLDASVIEGAVYPYLGPQRAVEETQAAADNLERAYRDAGYPTIYVDIPEQDVVGGVVLLQVREGRIDRVRVEGARYFVPSGIRAQLPAVQRGQALHVPTLQQELSALNAQSPDLKVVPVLKPGRSPGTVDVDLKVRDEAPLHGAVELTNYGSASTSDTRLSATLSYDNLWQRQHSLSLQWQISPEEMDEVNVLAATYVMPWGDSGNRLAFYAIRSDSDVATLGDINVIGDGAIYGARFVMPLPSTPGYIHSLGMGVDYKDYDEIIRLDTTNSIQTPIDYAVWSFQYNATQYRPAAQLQWGLGVNFGLRGVGNSDEEFVDKRNRAEANFSYLRGSLVRTDFLPADWQLISSLRVQVSDSPLINNEQFSAGGKHSVRGYYESQALGDNGAIAGLELRTPKLVDAEAIDDLRLSAFVEAARLRIEDALPDQDASIDLASAGLGLQLQAWSSTELALDWAYALKENGSIERGDSKVHVGLQWKF